MRGLENLGISTDNATANKDAKEAAILKLCKQQYTINKQIHLRMHVNRNFTDPTAFEAAKFDAKLLDNRDIEGMFYYKHLSILQ
jgi:hypothetical protein